MKTLYDLLEALPEDDAEDLRTAFRKAVKGAHPDLNPGDPDAALKFRRIARAHEILSDEEQREAYDYLLELARLEEQEAARQARAAKVQKFASGVMAVAGAAILTAGVSMLFVQLSAAPITPANDVATGGSSTLLSLAQIVSADANETQASLEPPTSHDESRATSPSARIEAKTESAGEAETVGAAHVGPPLDLAAIAAGQIGEPARSRHGKPANANTEVAALVSQSPGAYIDRNAIFYRPQSRGNAFAQLGPVRPPEKVGRVSPAPPTKRGEAHLRSILPRRTAYDDASRQGGG
jgi:curved DNA-binding protein CbpA